MVAIPANVSPRSTIPEICLKGSVVSRLILMTVAICESDSPRARDCSKSTPSNTRLLRMLKSVGRFIGGVGTLDEDIPAIGVVEVLPAIGVVEVLPAIGADDVLSVDAGGVADGSVPAVGAVVADGVVVFAVSGVVLVGPGGVEVGAVVGAVGVSATCAKAPDPADASIAATALASAKRCKVVRVDMGGKAPFY